MHVLSVNIQNEQNRADFVNKNPHFGHSCESINDSKYSPSQKALIAGMSVLGVAGSLAILAKRAGYSLKPSKMFKDIKNSYLAKVDFEAKEVIAMGAGSCAGGLAAGCIIDKDAQNRRAKVRETVMQVGNVSIPILTVDLMVDKIFKNFSEGVKAFAGLGGVAIGVVIANFLMNKLNNWIFHEGKEKSRGVKVTDFSAHLDDVVVAASYISKARLVHAIGRIIPVALVVPGVEVGNKTAY